MTHYQTLNVPDNAEHNDIVDGHEICLLAQTDNECVFGYVVADDEGDVTDDKNDPQCGDEIENSYVPEPSFWLK